MRAEGLTKINREAFSWCIILLLKLQFNFCKLLKKVLVTCLHNGNVVRAVNIAANNAMMFKEQNQSIMCRYLVPFVEYCAVR